LQQALLENVPGDIIHLGKKLVSVEAEGQDGVTLRFEDKTFAKADLLLGADGLHSVGQK